MSDKIIQVENVSKWFGDFQALKDVNLEVSLKEKVFVVFLVLMYCITFISTELGHYLALTYTTK